MTTRFLPEEYGNFFEYLDNLRESGGTNMFGAGPFLQSRFDLERDDAKHVLLTWMKTFSKNALPSDRARATYEKTLGRVS